MISNRQIKAARALLDWSQRDLAEHSRLPEAAVAKVEGIEGPVDGLIGEGDRLVATLRRAGVVFLDDGVGPGVRVQRLERDEGLRPEQLTTENDD